jgi:hypothetical protein
MYYKNTFYNLIRTCKSKFSFRGLNYYVFICRETLAFATEPVFCSLANVLNKHDNMPNPFPTDFKEYKLFEVEIKHGLLQVKYLCE